MEIGDEHLDYLVLKTRSYNNLCACMQRLKMVCLKICQYILNRLTWADAINYLAITVVVIRLPLIDMELVFSSIGIILQFDTYII